MDGEPSIEILGVETDPAKALESARSLQPEVIIVEELAEPGRWERLQPFIRLATAGRIVVLNLNHEYVTVYDEHRIAARGPADLAEAIRGFRGYGDQTDSIAQVRPVRKHEAKRARNRAADLAECRGGRNHEEH